MRKRTWSDEQLLEAFTNSVTMMDVLRKLNLRPSGGSYTNLYKHLERLGLSFVGSRKDRQLSGVKQHQFQRKYNDEDVFTTSSVVSQATLCNRYSELRKQEDTYYCNECGVVKWGSGLLVLHVDHVNGDPTDNRLCNLRLLCPNCHSLTSTWGNKTR